jgi:hypothetical protein
VADLILILGTLAAVLSGTSSAIADPVIVMSPNPAKTGAKNQVTFEAPLLSTAQTWDLDGDGVFGDREGSTVQWAYDLPRVVNVGLRYVDAVGAPTEVTESLRVIGPPTGFLVYPPVPVPGELVTFAYSHDLALPNPPEWDLNGDGAFPDATGGSTARTFPSPGNFLIGLRVSDVDDAVSTGFQTVTVVPATVPVNKLVKVAPRLMSPFPIVRITGKVSKKGARIKRLTVRAPFGATINVRCRGRRCPFRRTSRTVARVGKVKSPSATIRIKRLEGRFLRGGTSIKVLVSRQGEVGKYTKFRIRSGRPPVRTDLCLAPATTAPTECPAS